MKKIINLFKEFWSLNLEAKIGILFLIPPIWGVFAFIFQVNLKDINSKKIIPKQDIRRQEELIRPKLFRP